MTDDFDEEHMRSFTGYGKVERDARWRAKVGRALEEIKKPGVNSPAHAVLMADYMHYTAGLRPYQGPVQEEVWR